MISEGCVIHARHPLVVAQRGELGRAAVQAGIRCAQQNSGRLFIAYASQPANFKWLGVAAASCTLLPPQLPSDVDDDEQAIAAIRREVPCDVPLRTQLIINAHAQHKQILAVAEAFACDAIIVPEARSIAGRRAGLYAALERRSPIPVSGIDRPNRASRGSRIPALTVPSGPIAEAL